MQPATVTNPLHDKIRTDLDNLLKKQFCITVSKETMQKYFEEVPKIYNPENLQPYENKLREIAEKINNDIKNTCHQLATTIAFNNIKQLIEKDKSNPTQQNSLMLILRDPICSKLLKELIVRKHATNNSFAMVVLYDLIHLGDLDTRLNDSRIDTRILAPQITTLLAEGFINLDIFILLLLDSSCEQLNLVLPQFSSIFSQLELCKSFLDTHIKAAINNTNQLIFNAYRRRFLRDFYQEFLYQLDKLLHDKYSYPIESIPSLVAIEPEGFSFTVEATRQGYYVKYQQIAAKFYYQYLRRSISDKSPNLMSTTDLKSCLVIDRNMEFHNRKGVAYITPDQINAALQLQTIQVREKFNTIIKSNNLNQLRDYITGYALTHNIIIKREIPTDDIQLIQSVFIATDIDIITIDSTNPDLTLTGKNFTLDDVIKACADQSSWNNFISKLLHEHKLSNHLLKLILTTHKALIRTDQTVNSSRYTELSPSPSDDTHKIMQLLRTQKSIYSGAATQNNQIKYRTTLGMQIFNIHALSPMVLKTRLQILIDAGCSLDDHNTISNTALHTFIVYEREELVDVLLDFNKTLAKEKQLNPNIQNTALNSLFADGRTPLHLAVQTFASLTMIKRLLAIGANPNIQDELGATPLNYAVLLSRVDIIVLLIKSGARLDLKDKQGNSPFDYLDNSKIAKLYAEFGVTSAADAIKKSGYLTSMKYEARCVGARQNYLLSNPEGHEYFWTGPTTGQAGDMDKKLMFPTIRNLYFENNATNKPSLTELKNKMAKDNCNAVQQAFVMKQIENLDEEILFDYILTERERLQELYAAEKNDTTQILKILHQEYVIYEQIYSQLAILKECDNTSIEINLNNILQVNLLRRNGKYHLNIKILIKDEINLQNCVDLDSHYAATDENYVFDEIHLSQLNRFVSVILTSKLRTLPYSIHRNSSSQASTLSNPSNASANNIQPPHSPNSDIAMRTTKDVSQSNIVTLVNQPSASVPLSHEPGLASIASDRHRDPFFNRLSSTLSKTNLGDGNRLMSFGAEDYFYGIKPEDRQLWDELKTIGDARSVQAVLEAKKQYLLTHVVGNPHDPIIKMLRQNECAYGNIILHSKMINSHDQSVIKLINPDKEQLKLLASVCSGADYLLRYYEMKQQNTQTAKPKAKVKKIAEINTAIAWKDIQSKTPLLLACKNVNQSYATRLIALDNDRLTLNAVDSIELRSPLHIACILGLRDVAKKLIDLNVEQCADKYGMKPLDYLGCSPGAKLDNIKNVLLSVNFFAGRYFNEGHMELVCNELLKQNNILQMELAALLNKAVHLVSDQSSVRKRVTK